MTKISTFDETTCRIIRAAVEAALAEVATARGLDYLTLHYETEVLSDGSEVNNIRIS